MELGPHHGMWVSVEDGVEVLNFRNGGAESHHESDDSDEVMVIEGKAAKRRGYDVSENSSSSSKRKRTPRLSSAGLSSMCGHQNLGNVFVTSCMHNTCRNCLKSHVDYLLKKSMRTLEPSYNEIKVQLLCPDQRCGLELSKADLINLLEIDTVKNYETWLRTACKDLYGAASSANVMNCIRCQQGRAIKCSIVSSTKGKGKAKVNDDLNHFQNGSSTGSIQCLDQWVCSNCEFTWCAACGFTFNCQSKVDKSKGSHICSEATNYMINDIVTKLESIYNQYITVKIKTDVQPVTTNKSDDQPVTTCSPFHINPPGMFYGLYGGENNKNSVWGAGTGFGGHRREGKSTQEKVRKIEKELDSQAESLFKSLTSVLKNKGGNQLQPTLGFSTSAVLGRENVVGQILVCFVMNDSMMDICARGALYVQLADLLETMAQYPELLLMLKGSSSQSDRKDGTDVHGKNGGEASLIKKMKNIYEQSKIIVSRFKDGKHDVNVETDLGIARRLLECYEKLATLAGKQTPSTPSVISVSDEEDSAMTGDSEATSDQVSSASKEECLKNMEDNEVSSEQYKNVSSYKESLKPLQFKECPLLGTGFQCHTYSKYFDESGSNKQSIDNNGVHNKKRMLHIVKEIASLATNLPLEWESSIHVRVDHERVDLLKALIVGPKGTPYQNGVFIFDIYLPPDYPQVPPKVTFLTTGCGKVRFNPNLYHDGKVCLSLLGTWDGPSWQPWKSTLLQVLVSIQSLIFVAEPYYNEPGYEHMTNSRGAAEEENRNHRYNTLRYAILGALQNPDPSFKDLIIMHFQQKKDEIVNQCHEWVNACGDSTHQLYNRVAKTAEDVTLELVRVLPL